MSESIFRFKQFEIRQECCAMKVGTDGVLLGAWAPLQHAQKILDIGSGTGLLSLMAAQRNYHATIDAVEIDLEAANQATQNFIQSPWKDRLRVFCCPIQHFVIKDDTKILPLNLLGVCHNKYLHSDAESKNSQRKSFEAYDFIISNPPFYEEQVLSDDPKRNIARSAVALPFSVLFECVASLMTTDGMFALIYPAQAEESVQLAAVFQNMYCLRRCEVKTVGRKPAKRIMALYGRQMLTDFIRETLSIHGEGGVYSEEYISLTKDFYLQF